MKLRAIAILTLLILLGAWTLDASAQRPGGDDRPGHRREGRGGSSRRGLTREDRARRDALRDRAQQAFRRLAGDRARSALARRFDRMAGQLAYRVADDEIGTLEQLGDAELVRAIVTRWIEDQRRRDDRLLGRLGPEAQGEVEGLEGEARHRKILELHAAAILERAIEKAARQGLISAEEAEALRALPPDRAMDAAQRLHRKMILFVHRDEIDAGERARLEKLPAGSFFRDPAVRRLRFGPQLSRAQLRSLEKLDEDQRRQLVAALSEESGAKSLEELSFLEEEVRASLLSMKPESRRRFARMAKRMLFRHRHLYRPHRELFGRLDEAERRRFMELDEDRERFAFLEQRFPEVDWARARDSWAAHEEIRTLVGPRRYLMRAIEGGAETELADRLREAGLEAATIEKILALRARLDPATHDGSGGRRGGRGSRGEGEGGSDRMRRLMETLDDAERRELEAIEDPRARMTWLRKRFPEAFEGRRRPGGRRRGAR